MSDLFGNHIVGFPTRRLINANVQEEMFANNRINFTIHGVENGQEITYNI